MRSEFEPNGEFNITEFGTIKDPAQFKALYAYSPYHHVVDGTQVPGDAVHDRRARPARRALELAQDDRAPAGREHLGRADPARTSATTGHGIGSPLSARNEETAD